MEGNASKTVTSRIVKKKTFWGGKKQTYSPLYNGEKVSTSEFDIFFVQTLDADHKTRASRQNQPGRLIISFSGGR